MFEQYWGEVDTTVPRLNKTSLMMVSFNPVKYNRTRQVMTAKFKQKEEQSRPMVTFRRV
jgi:hypothetical protein